MHGSASVRILASSRPEQWWSTFFEIILEMLERSGEKGILSRKHVPGRTQIAVNQNARGFVLGVEVFDFLQQLVRRFEMLPNVLVSVVVNFQGQIGHVGHLGFLVTLPLLFYIHCREDVGY